MIAKAITPPFCPHCGHNIVADACVVIDGWTIAPDYAERDGERVHLTPSEAIVLHSIAAARGRILTDAVLRERCDSEAESNIIKVTICHLRQKLPGVPIETAWGTGYRWRTEAAAHG